jgi:hypothetical protein
LTGSILMGVFHERIELRIERQQPSTTTFAAYGLDSDSDSDSELFRTLPSVNFEFERRVVDVLRALQRVVPFLHSCPNDPINIYDESRIISLNTNCNNNPARQKSKQFLF